MWGLKGFWGGGLGRGRRRDKPFTSRSCSWGRRCQCRPKAGRHFNLAHSFGCPWPAPWKAVNILLYELGASQASHLIWDSLAAAFGLLTMPGACTGDLWLLFTCWQPQAWRELQLKGKSLFPCALR